MGIKCRSLKKWEKYKFYDFGNCFEDHILICVIGCVTIPHLLSSSAMKLSNNYHTVSITNLGFIPSFPWYVFINLNYQTYPLNIFGKETYAGIIKANLNVN
jgi:hypothetical protein